MKTIRYLPGLLVFAVLFLLLYGCGKGDSSTGAGYIDSTGSGGSGQSGGDGQTPVTDWLIPVDEVYNGGVGMDGIPALTDPHLISGDEAEGDLHVSDIVIGVLIENEARAYPHYILDWHEIINDEIGTTAFALTYCPLTGSGIALNRDVGGYVTTFGVSGLLYNSNLMPYDRLTRSYWSQMRLLSVKGPLVGEEFEFIPIVETTWETWKEMYPDTQVVSTQTGYQRSYGRYPYGSYRTSNDLIFPVSNLDGRFHRKERMHGILVGDMATALSIETLPEEITTLNHTLNSTDIVTVGSSEKNFAVSFERLLDDKVLEFAVAQNNQPVIMIDDDTGSGWDAFGRCIKGPYKGKQLKPVVSFIAYWFSWVAFFPESEILNM